MKINTKTYKSSKERIAKAMVRIGHDGVRFGWSDEVTLHVMRTKRLELDIADLLTGPTCGAEAERLAFLLVQGDLDDIATTLIEIGNRYLQLKNVK